MTEVYLKDSYEGEDVKMSSNQVEEDDKEYPCLVRATDGKNIQFSTTVGTLDFKPLSFYA